MVKVIFAMPIWMPLSAALISQCLPVNSSRIYLDNSIYKQFTRYTNNIKIIKLEIVYFVTKRDRKII